MSVMPNREMPLRAPTLLVPTLLAVTFLLMMLTAGAALAADAKVSVTVMDGTSGAGGATVTIKDSAGKTVETGTADQAGKYKTRLPPGTYTIESEKDGKTSTETITHGARKTTVITFLGSGSGSGSASQGVFIPAITAVVPSDMGQTVTLNPGVDPQAFLATNGLPPDTRVFAIPGDCPPEEKNLITSSIGRFATPGDHVARSFMRASSHSEAPLICIDPDADLTDYYVFVTPSANATVLCGSPSVASCEAVACLDAQLPAAGTFAPYIASQAAPRRAPSLIPIVLQSLDWDVQTVDETGQQVDTAEITINFGDTPLDEIDNAQQNPGDGGGLYTWQDYSYYSYFPYTSYEFAPEDGIPATIDTDLLNEPEFSTSGTLTTTTQTVPATNFQNFTTSGTITYTPLSNSDPINVVISDTTPTIPQLTGADQPGGSTMVLTTSLLPDVTGNSGPTDILLPGFALIIGNGWTETKADLPAGVGPAYLPTIIK